MIQSLTEWKQTVNNGETLFSHIEKDFPTINNPPAGIVNTIIQEDSEWSRRVLLRYDLKSTICIPTSKGWLVLDKTPISATYQPHILGAIASEEDKYIRETYILSGMTETDVLNYLEEL